MIDWFLQGGVPMWLVLGAGLVGLGLAVDAGRRVAGGAASADGLRAEIDGVLFWGGLAAVLGGIGTLGGVALMARSLEQAGGGPASVVWGGLRVALIPTAFGLGVLTVCLLAWYGLRTALRRARSG
jgi:biopolymer transport protein ExbB/TolQ